MIVSKNWLSDYVALPSDVEELTGRLTMSGLNLEEFHPTGDGVLRPDVAIDLEVTSNRPDCLGHIGVAREIAVLYEAALSVPDPQPPEVPEKASEFVSVEIECRDLCPEYHARLIRGVQIGPSPQWLRDRLAAVGIKSVNNVVDVTNYVMMECGHPLHAFDFEKLTGGKIVVRRARSGERMTAIDQRQYQLTEEVCVIADANQPVAIAGVMGGFDTEISDSTVNVLIESAAFDSMSVRATARALRLHSPSSYRFERRVDRHGLDWASRRCCELILKVAGGVLLAGAVVAGDPPLPRRDPIRFRHAQVERLLGIRIPVNECWAVLERLGLVCRQRGSEIAEFEPPSWRPDLQRECDLVEEVARIFGYDNIPDDAIIPVVATRKTRREMVLDAVRETLVACGLSESLTLSFVSDEQRNLFRPEGELNPVCVSHSSRSNENQLRQSLIPSLLHCLRQNERHGNFNVELFEIARVFLSAGENKPEDIAEPLTIGIAAGRSYADVLGIIESIVRRIAPRAVLTVEPCRIPEFAEGRGARLELNGQHWGWIGELRRDVLDSSELQEDVCVAEVRLPVLEVLFEQVKSFVPLPRFPEMSRDLNFIIPDSVSWSDLQRVVSDAAGALLHGTSFGGQYRGRQIPAGHKSYLITCRFLSLERTLTSEEVDDAVRQIIRSCESMLGATLRS